MHERAEPDRPAHPVLFGVVAVVAVLAVFLWPAVIQLMFG